MGKGNLVRLQADRDKASQKHKAEEFLKLVLVHLSLVVEVPLILFSQVSPAWEELVERHPM